MKYQTSLKAKLIYIFRINDKAHAGCVKIGEATLPEASSLNLPPNCHELNQAAKARINQYTQTAGVDYDLLHTELTLHIEGGSIVSFNDKAVHEVLLRSGVKRHDFSTEKQGSEWFECDLQTALEAIKAVKHGQTALDGSKVTKEHNPVVFRPEQKEAIAKTVKKFQHEGSHMLWNAKMRFGKTLSALEVVRQCQFHRTLILTHRPVVDKGWFEDFGKIFYDYGGHDKKKETYRYGSRNNGFMFTELEKDASRYPLWHYIYFASMQDLRGSEQVGGKFEKNEEILSAPWDCLIIDEAHEGTQTQLGQSVLDSLQKQHTCILNLSGTPFNLLDDFNEDEVYTWDYVMEQRAKQEWDLNHFGDPNPYAGLPRLNIFTFDLGKIVSGYADVEDAAFNFKEFFRTWTGDPKRDHVNMPANTEIGRFVHEKDVLRFLDLIVKYDKESNYPYSTAEYRRNFRHSLWMLPGVKEARALSTLLKDHTVFQHFEIVNVAGEGDEEAEHDEALKMVEKAMGDNPEETFTITLSCGRLTTGVTVRPWTAVFMLAGSAQTDAKAYMQTIFRVQSPYEAKSGKRKEECFVFDFAPDRTLKVIAQVAKITAKAGKVQSDDDRATMGQFLNFCPIIGYNGTRMEAFNVEGMLEQLKRAYVDRVVRHGFEDAHLYNDNLLKLTDVELRQFEDLKKIIGATKASHGSDDVDINKQGFTDEEYEQIEKAKKKPKKELTEEEKRLLEELKKKRSNRQAAISILRGISIRFPLLIYGADLTNENEDVTIDNFAKLIDDQSWDEFMPNGVTKEKFAQFIKYYDPDIFRAAGRQIRDMARAADSLAPAERVQRIARIFGYFRNPDKETVLTPWRVVNMHISNCLGGWDFYDETHDDENGLLAEPRFVDRGEPTQKVFLDPDTRILEINSKTGLYPLYMTYSTFAARCQRYRDEHSLPTNLPDDKQRELWDKTLAENIFVICKTPMAKSITRRTLRGFRNAKVNAKYFEDLINQIQNKQPQFIAKVTNGKIYWNANNEKNMKFNAIVGNPPYQLTVAQRETENGQKAVVNIFHHFQIISDKLGHYTSLIYPGARWIHRSGKGLADFGKSQINDPHLSLLYFYPDANEIFKDAGIADGISIVLKDEAKTSSGFQYIYSEHGQNQVEFMENPGESLMSLNPADASIVNKIEEIVKENKLAMLHDSVLPRSLFSIESNFVEINPTLVREYSEGELFNPDTEIKLLTNDKAGKSGRARWYVASKDVITTGTEYLDKWKVVVSSANAGGQKRSNQIAILDNHSAFGRARVALKTFDTKKEAQNFFAYAQSKLIRFAFLMTDESLTSLALKVPDILNYSDKNKFIDFRSDIDQQLFDLFKISSVEQRHIEEVLARKEE